jgi:hypothetical protein
MYRRTQLLSRARLALGSRLRGKWFLGLRPLGDAQAMPPEMNGFRIIVAPPGRFYADPFLLEWNDRHFLFFEDYSFAAGRGRISYCEIYQDTSISPPALALERDYHLSYPFLLIADGELHMLPEMAEHSALELYHAPVFPGEFTRSCTLMDDFQALDPTIVHWQDRLWLFVNSCPTGSNVYDGLDLFWADELLGPWHPHPMNPVVRDIGSARPAGAVFELDGRLIRPAQDCSLRYGHQVVFNCIERLDLIGYREREIGRIGADWLPDNLATHTYNRNRRFEVVDGQWLTSDKRWFDMAVRGVSRLVDLPTASAVRGRQGWQVAALNRAGRRRAAAAS